MANMYVRAFAKSFPLEDSPSLAWIAVVRKVASQRVLIAKKNRIRYMISCPIRLILKMIAKGDTRTGDSKRVIKP